MQAQRNHENTIEELYCSVCMCLFKNPVTIECGHTYCRFCLLNYTRTKLACPICRTTLAHVAEHPPQDHTIANIVDYVKDQQAATRKQASLNESKESTKLEHIQNLLLVDIRCSDLLLPYTKVKATFQLQSSTLLGKLQRFVARQDTPFNKFGVVAKITSLNQLRHTIYECSIEGKSFCQITNQEIQKQEEQNEEYFYRVCQAKIIYEDDEIQSELHDKFLLRFMEIKDKNMLKYISKMIDPEKLFSKSNPLAVYYSIMKIISQPNSIKYEVITSFDPSKRQQFLRAFLQQLPTDLTKSPDKLITTPQGSRMWMLVFLAILLLLVFFILPFNNDSSQL